MADCNLLRPGHRCWLFAGCRCGSHVHREIGAGQSLAAGTGSQKLVCEAYREGYAMKKAQNQENTKSIFSDFFWCPTLRRVTAVSDCLWRQRNPSYWACQACTLGRHWKDTFCSREPVRLEAQHVPFRTRRPKSGTRILDIRKGDIFTIAGQEWIVTKRLPGGKLLMRPTSEVTERVR